MAAALLAAALLAASFSAFFCRPNSAQLGVLFPGLKGDSLFFFSRFFFHCCLARSNSSFVGGEGIFGFNAASAALDAALALSRDADFNEFFNPFTAFSNGFTFGAFGSAVGSSFVCGFVPSVCTLNPFVLTSTGPLVVIYTLGSQC